MSHQQLRSYRDEVMALRLIQHPGEARDRTRNLWLTMLVITGVDLY